MANFLIFGLGKSLFEAQGSLSDPQRHDFASNVLYVTPTEFGFRNPDGSFTFFTGTDFVADPDFGIGFTGTVTGIKHFNEGLYVDELQGLNIPVNQFWNTSGGLPGSFMRLFSEANTLGGDDTIDARNRVGGAIVDTVLNGYIGNDTIYSGAGNDKLNGGYGNDVVWGGAGNDVITDEFDAGGSPGGNDRFFGQDGNDRLSGFDGDDYLNGGNGNDTLVGGRGSDTILGGAGNDLIVAEIASDANNTINGGSGTDTMVFNLSRDDITSTRSGAGFTLGTFVGSDAVTSVERIAADDGTYQWSSTRSLWVKINSVSGTELLSGVAATNGTAGDDVITLPNQPNNVAYGLDGNDRLTGGTLGNLMFGGNGDDVIAGNGGNDRIYGDAGNDQLSGGEGFDILKGGAGTDAINGGRGSDRLSGGTSADTFTFVYESNATRDRPLFGNDIITDFQVGVDRIALNLGQGASFLAPALSLTADGWLVTTGDLSSTVLLQGVTTANLTLADILLV